MKDYTLDENRVQRKAEAILKHVGTPTGWSAQHFTVYKDQLYWKPDAILGETEWTERQSDIHRITVEGFLVLQEAFRLHQLALDNRNWDTVTFTLDQLRTVTFSAFAGAVEQMQPITTASTHHQSAGRKGKGARRIKGRNWDTICSDYTQLMSEGLIRLTVTTRLSKKYNMSKNDLNRGLRTRGCGSNPRKH